MQLYNVNTWLNPVHPICRNKSLLAYLTQCEPWLPLALYNSITAGFRSTAWPNVCASVCSHSITHFTPGQGYPTPPSIFLRGQGLACKSQQTSGGNKVSLSTRRNVSRFIPLTSHPLNQMNFLLYHQKSYTLKQVPIINHIPEILAFFIWLAWWKWRGLGVIAVTGNMHKSI